MHISTAGLLLDSGQREDRIVTLDSGIIPTIAQNADRQGDESGGERRVAQDAGTDAYEREAAEDYARVLTS